MKQIGIALAALIAFGTPAAASPIYFTLTGTDSAKFSIDSDATPFVQTGSTPSAFYVDVPGLFDGQDRTATVAFYPTVSGGGFQATFSDNSYISPVGAVLFTGALDNPTFTLGTFLFTSDFSRGAISDTLVISDTDGVVPPGSVPEPASWTLMMAGFGMVGGALRGRRRTSVVVG